MPATETPTAPAATCATCAQALTEWTNHLGVTMLVADDGWGSICGDAPRGFHAPGSVPERFYPADADALDPPF